MAVREAMHAEWTKLRTLASTPWLVAALVVLTVAVSAAVVVATNYQPLGGQQDTTKVSLAGLELGQVVAVVLGVLAVSGEYSSRMIVVTLTAMPRRLTVLAAKAADLTALVLLAGVVAVGGCLLVGRAVLPAHGFTVAHGYAPLALTATTLRAAGGSVLYLALIGLLSLGVAAAVRDTATSIVVVLGLLYLFPLIARAVSNPTWHRHLEQIGPMTAGLGIQATTDIASLPIGPWPGLGVLAAWAAAALLTGGALLRMRDA